MGAKLPFVKMSGAGNDFVVLDNRKGQVAVDLRAFAAAVCDRRRGVGGDGLLLVEPSSRKDFRMRYYNADGSEADMCGNGARCIARYASLIGAAAKVMEFENNAGDFKATLLDGDGVEVQMTDPRSVKLDLTVSVDGQAVLGHSADTGVPHFVVPVADVDAVDVAGLGRTLRFHPDFAPNGTNVNFVQVLGPKALKVRTYERGVEGETLACGTGVVAAAVLMARSGEVASPVAVRVRGGDEITVGFELKGDGAAEVRMKGPAEITFEGTLDLDRYIRR